MRHDGVSHSDAMSGRVQTPHLRDRCASRFCSGLVYIPENWILGARGINSHKLRIALQQHRAGAHMLAAPAEMLGGGELPLIKWLLRSGCDSLQFDDLPAPSMKTRPHLLRKRISAAILDTACRPPPMKKRAAHLMERSMPAKQDQRFPGLGGLRALLVCRVCSLWKPQAGI